MMKKPIPSLLFFLLFIISIPVLSQEIVKYDYLEVIVVQKSNNAGKVKRIRVDEQPSLEGETITIKVIEKIKDTSSLLSYMNAANWEFLDRQAIVSGVNDPVWMSYIFRKKK
jgi:hypothetical protein|tara:strand:+ start:1626 stop:1961 length:336 start_codon:yes stop_codon:yes gene_type:complete